MSYPQDFSDWNVLPTSSEQSSQTDFDSTPHLDNTLRQCYKKCARKFYFLHRLHIRTLYGSTALRYGSVWHAGQEAFYTHIMENGWTRDGAAMHNAVTAMQKEWEDINSKEVFYEDYRTLENCLQSFLQYMNYFAGDENHLEVVEAEKPFKIHMEVENEYEAEMFPNLVPFHFTGKKDLEIKLNGRLWVMEHKTTGQPIDQQVQRLNRSAQVMGYTYATIRKNGSRKEAPDGALINLHHLSARKSTSKGKEGEYGAPKIDFRRHPQIFNDNDLNQWRISFLATAYEIQQEDERGLWPMNHDACYDFGSCPFLPICQMNENIDNISIDPGRYRVAEPWEVAKDVKAEDVVY